ncbi:unnamed protein product [Vitrella brassicaformis CCMP3155]|uniref:Armadillo repeat-containing domain-containing protein n=1 Tax=Vitrella brassicaformis (strain CCMP3155) TaxID=1169540 RepID=A0A0G4FRG3_VITBC|nr:unnamed protein product [Vitrella brassicaformis CCMP3155]|eukprot:CEM16834.1 unnamed protein product [Vitrella brassicaformis CCMP3155]
MPSGGCLAEEPDRRSRAVGLLDGCPVYADGHGGYATVVDGELRSLPASAKDKIIVFADTHSNGTTLKRQEASSSTTMGHRSANVEQSHVRAACATASKLDEMDIDNIQLPNAIMANLRSLTGDLDRDFPIIESALKKIIEASTNGPKAEELGVCFPAIAEVARKYGVVSGRVVHLCLLAIAKMCFKSRANRRHVTRVSFRKDLSFMLELVGFHKHDPKVQQSLSKLLSIIGLEEDGVQSLDNKLALGHIMEAMRVHQNDKDVFGLGCHAIAAISANDSTLRAKLLKDDGLVRVLTGLRRFVEDGKVCNAVAQLLYCLCIRVDLGHHKIIENEGIELLISAMEEHPTHTGLIKFVALVLSHLAFMSPKCNQSTQEILTKRAGVEKTLDGALATITTEHQANRDPVEEVGWDEAEKAARRLKDLCVEARSRDAEGQRVAFEDCSEE